MLAACAGPPSATAHAPTAIASAPPEPPAPPVPEPPVAPTSGPLSLAPPLERSLLLHMLSLEGAPHLVFESRPSQRPLVTVHRLNGLALDDASYRWEGNDHANRVVRVVPSIDGEGPWILVRPDFRAEHATRVVAHHLSQGAAPRELLVALPETRVVSDHRAMAVAGDPPRVILGVEGRDRVLDRERARRRAAAQSFEELAHLPSEWRTTAMWSAYVGPAGAVEVARARPPRGTGEREWIRRIAGSEAGFVGAHEVTDGGGARVSLTWLDRAGGRVASADDVLTGARAFARAGRWRSCAAAARRGRS
jgi:hypothetical protein